MGQARLGLHDIVPFIGSRLPYTPETVLIKDVARQGWIPKEITYKTVLKL